MQHYVGPSNHPDRYRLLQRHSRGGEGELWRAQLLLETVPITVAVKVGHPEITLTANDVDTSTPSSSSSQQRHTTRRWQQQTELLRTLDHPNLVRVREAFQGPAPHPPATPPQDNEPRLYLVMNWIEGPTIARWVQTQHPTPGQIVAMLSGIADALDGLHTGAHTAGTTVLHRDVKPANLIVCGDQAKLVDFGLARLLDPDGATLSMAGTPAFLAPETITDQRFGPASDRYAFAATLYQLLTGTSPNVFEPVRMRTELRQLPVGDPKLLADLMLTGLHTDPEQRPHKLTDWLDEVATTLTDRTGDRPNARNPSETTVPTRHASEAATAWEAASEQDGPVTLKDEKAGDRPRQLDFNPPSDAKPTRPASPVEDDTVRRWPADHDRQGDQDPELTGTPAPSDGGDIGIRGGPHGPIGETPDAKGGPEAQRKDRSVRRLRAAAMSLVLLVAVAAGIGGFLLSQQYFVGLDDDQLVVYRGVDTSIGPVELSWIVERSSLTVNDVQGWYGPSLEAGVPAINLNDARRIIDNAPLNPNADSG